MAEKQKKKWGDRRDGTWLRDIDGMHGIMAYVYPNRADNEAFIQETFEMEPIYAYVDKKNAELKEKVEKGELPPEALEDPYKVFQVLLAALVKTIYLRPKLNRFIAGKKFYQRNVVSVGFTVKKKKTDNGAEALAYKEFGPESTIDSVHDLITREINFCRDESQVDNSIDMMNTFFKLPPVLLRPVFCAIRWMDQRGHLPYSLIKTDPNYASAFLTHLGSIGLKAGYHHLSNWGTTSLFVIIGEKRFKPFYDREGNCTVKEVMDIGLTIDERIADGFYYAKSIRLIKKLLENPELLETRADEKIEF